MSERSAAIPRKKSKVFTTNYMVKIAIMAAVARVIMLLEFPLPMFPPFLQFDFSDLIPLLGSLAMGPFAGVLIELIKCLIHVINTTTGGVGDLANFVVGAAYVWSVGFFYHRHKTKRGAVTGLIIGIFAMIVAGAVVNYFITIPLYGLVMGWSEESIVGMGTAVLPLIEDKFTLILYAFSPFNLIKGIVLTLLALPLYKKFSPLLHKGLL
jgi:riboflavin transporter FmnP